MRINKFLFPIILLIIFFGVIAAGVAAGYWETKGGGRHQREPAMPDPLVMAAPEPVEGSWTEWAL